MRTVTCFLNRLTVCLSVPMEQSSTWNANYLLASQGIPYICLNLKVQHRVHKILHLSQSWPDQPTPCLFKLFIEDPFNIILQSIPRSSEWPLSLALPHQTPVSTSPIFHTCYMPGPSHSSLCDHWNNILWEAKLWSSSLCNRIDSPRPIFLLHFILKHPPFYFRILTF